MYELSLRIWIFKFGLVEFDKDQSLSFLRNEVSKRKIVGIFVVWIQYQIMHNFDSGHVEQKKSEIGLQNKTNIIIVILKM